MREGSIMKNGFKIAGLALALALTSAATFAEENIAYVDSLVLFQNHPDREVEGANIDAELKEPADKLKALEENIIGKMQSLEKEAPKLRQADIKKREDEINKLRQDYQTQLDALQKKNEELQLAARTRLIQSIRTATNEVAKQKKYSFVVDANAVVYAVDGKDITKEVLDNIKPSAKKAEK